MEQRDPSRETPRGQAPIAAESRGRRRSGLPWAVASAVCVAAAVVCLYALAHLATTPDVQIALWGEVLLALAGLACGGLALRRAGWREGSSAATALATACIVLGAILLLLGPGLAATARL